MSCDESPPDLERSFMIGWIVAGLLLVLVVSLAHRMRRERHRQRQRGPNASWPIPSADLEAIDPIFRSGPFGATLDSEVWFVGHGPIAVPGGTTDAETWILAALAKRAQHMFEFGTCTGKTSYLWSRNSPPGARVVTLTLLPSQKDQYKVAPGDATQDTRHALVESNFVEFLYTGTEAEGAITQLYGDSKDFDDEPYYDWADLVFVDGSHARSYVESDSKKAMRMVKPGGLVLWHDYAGQDHAPGVFEALNALSKTATLRHIRGTTFVAWRRPL